MAQFEELTAEVERAEGIDASAITLINGIADQIDAAIASNDASDNSSLVNLSARLRATSDALAAAVQANSGPPSAEG